MVTLCNPYFSKVLPLMGDYTVMQISMNQPDEAIASALGSSFQTNGFAVITDHGVHPSLLAEVYGQVENLFALPREVLMSFHNPDWFGQVGYTPPQIETAKDASVPDEKDFWHIKREDDPGAELKNVWPDEGNLVRFKHVTLVLYDMLETLGTRLLGAIDTYLGLPKVSLPGMVKGGKSILRLLHYPPTAGDEAGLRAAGHEDINFITLLVAATQSGLEIDPLGDGN